MNSNKSESKQAIKQLDKHTTNTVKIKKNLELEFDNLSDTKKFNNIVIPDSIVNESDKDIDKLEEDSEKSDEYSEKLEEDLEKEFEQEINQKQPPNYGNKWDDADKERLIKLLNKYNIKSLDENEKINKIAKKLERTVGGIKYEIKRIIYEKYFRGIDAENISKEFNLSYRDIKFIIRNYIEKDSDKDILMLERENKILRLKIENFKLKKELKEINQ